MPGPIDPKVTIVAGGGPVDLDSVSSGSGGPRYAEGASSAVTTLGPLLIVTGKHKTHV